MRLIIYSQIQFTKKLLLLVRSFLFITALCTMGCDSLFVKRIELQKPIDSLQIEIYEHNKTKIVSTIDGIATNNNMFCKTTLDIIRYCNQPPQTLVVFEDKSGFFVCLFMFGMDWEKNKFLHLAKTLEEAIIKSLPNTNLSISRPDELPECSVPPHTFENSRSQVFAVTEIN